MNSELILAVSINLGYGAAIPTEIGVLFDNYPSITPQIQSIIDEINQVDTLLAAARGDSMATQIDTIKVDYQQHINYLLDEGTRMLVQLSKLTNLELKYNKYNPDSMTGSLSSVYSKVSYW